MLSRGKDYFHYLEAEKALNDSFGYYYQEEFNLPLLFKTSVLNWLLIQVAACLRKMMNAAWFSSFKFFKKDSILIAKKILN